MFHLLRRLMTTFIGWLLFMIPITLSYSIVGVIFLSNHSANFRNVQESLTTLIIHGYLKPNDLRAETLKSPEYYFIEFFQTTYTMTGKCFVMAFTISDSIIKRHC